MGSDLARRFIPSTSLGKSAEFVGSTATRTTGDTENFIVLIQWAVCEVVIIPDFSDLIHTDKTDVFPAGIILRPAPRNVPS